MKPLPIRIRLTLWYSVMFATAALLLSLTSWWMLRRTIDATLRQDFQAQLVAQGDARLGNGRIVGIQRQIVDEGGVDLQ